MAINNNGNNPTMPIKKETSARLIKREVTHDSISREVVNSITDPVALAIYTYLITKPPDWVVRKTDIIKHFKPLGADAYGRGMRQLRELGLVWMADIRDGAGVIRDRMYIVEQTPNTGKPIFKENPSLGKTAPLKKKRLPKEEDIGIRGWNEWVDYRREIKKTLTEASVKKQVALLNEYPPVVQEAIINQSITNGWTGLFPIKESRNGQAKQNPNNGRKLSGAERTRIARDEARRRQTGG